MRGLRVPHRDDAVDPADLRRQADSMDRSAVLSHYPRAADAEGIVEAYRPLVEDLEADYVSIQIASLEPLGAMRLVSEEVLPRLRDLAGSAGRPTRRCS